MKILVTGATGFLGSTLLKYLCEQPSLEVVGLSLEAPPAMTHPRVTWLKGDLSNANTFDQLPKCDVVIHSVKSRNHRRFPELAIPLFEAHTTSTMRLLEWSRTTGVKRFLLASTGSIYGSKDEGQWSEDDLPTPDSFYGASKLASEILLNAYTPYFKCTVFRIFTLYGPGQLDHLIPLLVSRVSSGEEIIVSNSTGMFLTPAYSEDVVKAIYLSLMDSNPLELETLNVAGDEHFSIREISDEIGSLLGKKVNYKNVDGDKQAILGSNKKIKKKFPSLSFTSLKVGMSNTLNSLPKR